MRTIKTHLDKDTANAIVERWDAATITSDFQTPTANELDSMCRLCHAISVSRGWWRDPERNVGEAIALMHSELSEGLEGARKDLPSDHIAGFTMLEEEFADVLIRMFDFAHAAKLRLGAAFEAKCRFNLDREDHSEATRDAPGGKAF